LLTLLATFVWLSYRLFTLYSRGILFSDANVRYIKALGWWMIGAWTLSILVQVLHFLFDVEHVVFKFTVDGNFLGGLLVLLLAWIMEESKKLQDEQALTV
jgi:hypothetical protein